MTTCLGKSCSFGLPRVSFINCCQFMYLVLSLLVLRAGCGIWSYQFLVIAYLFTSRAYVNWDPMRGQMPVTSLWQMDLLSPSLKPAGSRYFGSFWSTSKDSDKSSLIRVFTVCMKKHWSWATHLMHSEDRSDWVDAHADQSLRWGQRSFCWFCHALAQMCTMLLKCYN